MCNKIQAPIITATLAAGSTTSPYFVQCNITQKLCYSTCAETAPVFSPQFSLVGVSQVGTGQYVATIHVEGAISYVKCGGDCCCTKQQPLSANFTVPIASATAPTVTITAGQAVNVMSASGCQTCSRVMVSETPLTLTVA